LLSGTVCDVIAGVRQEDVDEICLPLCTLNTLYGRTSFLPVSSCEPS